MSSATIWQPREITNFAIVDGTDGIHTYYLLITMIKWIQFCTFWDVNKFFHKIVFFFCWSKSKGAWKKHQSGSRGTILRNKIHQDNDSIWWKGSQQCSLNQQSFHRFNLRIEFSSEAITARKSSFFGRCFYFFV